MGCVCVVGYVRFTRTVVYIGTCTHTCHHPTTPPPPIPSHLRRRQVDLVEQHPLPLPHRFHQQPLHKLKGHGRTPLATPRGGAGGREGVLHPPLEARHGHRQVLPARLLLVWLVGGWCVVGWWVGGWLDIDICIHFSNTSLHPHIRISLTRTSTGSNAAPDDCCANLACADLRAERSPSAKRRHFCSLTAAASACVVWVLCGWVGWFI